MLFDRPGPWRLLPSLITSNPSKLYIGSKVNRKGRKYGRQAGLELVRAGKITDTREHYFNHI